MKGLAGFHCWFLWLFQLVFDQFQGIILTLLTSSDPVSCFRFTITVSPSKFTLASQTTPARTSRTSSSPVNATLKSSFYFSEVHVETHQSWCLKHHVFLCLVFPSWPDCQRGFVLQWQLCQMCGYRGFWVKVRTHWTHHLTCIVQFIFFISPKKKNWLPHEQVNH